MTTQDINYLAYFDQSSIPIVEVNIDGIILSVNKGADADIKHQMLGHSFYTFLDARDALVAKAAIQQCFKLNEIQLYVSETSFSSTPHQVTVYPKGSTKAQPQSALLLPVAIPLQTGESAISKKMHHNPLPKETYVGYWEYNLSTECIWWSDGTYHLFKIEKKEDPLTYANYLTLLDNDSATRVQQRVSQIQKDFQPYTHRISLRNCDETTSVR